MFLGRIGWRARIQTDSVKNAFEAINSGVNFSTILGGCTNKEDAIYADAVNFARKVKVVTVSRLQNYLNLSFEESAQAIKKMASDRVVTEKYDRKNGGMAYHYIEPLNPRI